MKLLNSSWCLLVMHVCLANRRPSVEQLGFDLLDSQRKILKSDENLQRTQGLFLEFPAALSQTQRKFVKSEENVDIVEATSGEFTSDWSLTQMRLLEIINKLEREQETSTDFFFHLSSSQKKIMKSKIEQMVSLESLKSEEIFENSREFPCPLAEAIAPCVCDYDVNHHLYLDCSEVTSNDQLHTILSQDFPAKDFYQFDLFDNADITYVTDIPSSLKFQRVNFDFVVNLELISDEFLLGSSDTLEYFAALYTRLHRTSFPFVALPFFTKLKKLDLYGTSTLTSVPKLESESLTSISFNNCSLQSIEPGTFDNVTRLEIVGLEFNDLIHLGSNSFLLTNSLKEIYLGYNGILNISPGAFVLDEDLESSSIRSSIHLYHNNLTELLPGTFPMADRSTGIYLSDNQITEISPGAFVLPNTTGSFDLSLSLYDNNLTELDEDVFGEIFPYLDDFWIEGNPFTCGCSLAWLLLSESFMDAIDDEPTCANGTLLADLDPVFYETFC